MTLSQEALAMIAEVFGPQSRVSVPVAALETVREIQRWLAAQAKPQE